MILKKMIPDYYYKSINEVPFEELNKSGIKVIFSDLDNTLIPYHLSDPIDENFSLKSKLESLGMKMIIVSNSKKLRVDNYANQLGIECVKSSKKPLKFGIKRAIKLSGCKKEEIMIVGDQLITDILGGNRAKINTCLVSPINMETEAKVTKRNRKIERFFLNRLKKKYKEVYNQKLLEFAGE